MPARRRPDKAVPSIESESGLQPDESLGKDIYPEISAPLFVDEGVLVGFWYEYDGSREVRPVYCLVTRGFEYAYLKGRTFALVRWIDFDHFSVFGNWMGDDMADYTNPEDCMNPEEVRAWVQTMWMSRDYAGNWDITADEDDSI